MKKVYEEDKVIYKDLKRKYDDCMKGTLILENKLKGMHAKLEGMKETEERYKKQLEDLKKHSDSIYYSYIY
jgi:hypothetical protein